MRAAFPLLLSLTFTLQCAAQSPAIPQYEALPGVAIYNQGYLFSWDSPQYSQVTLYGRDTKPAYSVPEHKDCCFYNAWTVDSDGVAAAAYETRQPWEGRIDLLDPNGKLTLTIKTGSYLPQHVVFAPDHTVWAVGYNAGNDGREDFNVLHHYARSGQELGQALLWSQIAGDINSYTALRALIGGTQLYVGQDRLGFDSLLHHDHSTWIEVSFSGALLGKYDLGRYGDVSYRPCTMTASAAVYAAIYTEEGFEGWAALDRSKQVWRKIAGYPKGKLIGSDGDNLVFSKGDGAWTVLQFVPSGSLRFEKLKQETPGLVGEP